MKLSWLFNGAVRGSDARQSFVLFLLGDRRVLSMYASQITFPVDFRHSLVIVGRVPLHITTRILKPITGQRSEHVGWQVVLVLSLILL